MLRRIIPGPIQKASRMLKRSFISDPNGGSATSVPSKDVLVNTDPEQARLMEEKVILVDAADNERGSMSKRDSHLLSNDLPLHRAFSVFLFDNQGRMLLQQRAAEKITFPSFWTNTVCSHPLSIPSETGELDNGDSVKGAKRAAIRKLSHELGVVEGAVSSDDLNYMTRILYRAPCDDDVWGEHELDYVFIVQKDIPLNPEPNEVQAVRYVDKSELKAMFREQDASKELLLTPWFRHIVQSFGWGWWDALLAEGLEGITALQDDKNIHVMS